MNQEQTERLLRQIGGDLVLLAQRIERIEDRVTGIEKNILSKGQ